jgi:hypothetical protein
MVPGAGAAWASENDRPVTRKVMVSTPAAADAVYRFRTAELAKMSSRIASAI